MTGKCQGLLDTPIPPGQHNQIPFQSSSVPHPLAGHDHLFRATEGNLYSRKTRTSVLCTRGFQNKLSHRYRFANKSTASKELPTTGTWSSKLWRPHRIFPKLVCHPRTRQSRQRPALNNQGTNQMNGHNSGHELGTVKGPGPWPFTKSHRSSHRKVRTGNPREWKRARPPRPSHPPGQHTLIQLLRSSY